jgi:hypothetical protein
MLSIDGEECILELPNGPTTFRSTTVKPYHADSDTDDLQNDDDAP